MKKYILCCFYLVFFINPFNSYAQVWERMYNDTNGTTSMGRCAIQGVEGNLYFTSDPAHIGQGQMAKLDPYGDVIWSTTMGGTSLAATSDSGCVLASAGYQKIDFRKLSKSGILQWSKSYSFATQHHSMSYITNVSTGGFIACGFANENGYLIRLDENGDSLWTYRSNNSNFDNFREVFETNDNGFVVVNNISISSLHNMRLIKVNSNGNVVWNRLYSNMYGSTICPTPDGGFIIPRGGFGISKFDSMGIMVDSINSVILSTISSLKQTADNGYIGAGSLYISNWDDDIFIAKLDSLFNIQWTQTYYNGPYTDFAETVDVLSDGGFLICGSVNYSGPLISTYIIRTDSTGNSTVGLNNELIYNDRPIKIVPNPFSVETKLYFNTSEEFSIRIYDALGREMVKLDGLKESPFVISRKNLKAGIYFIHLIQNNELIGQEKMVVLD